MEDKQDFMEKLKEYLCFIDKNRDCQIRKFIATEQTYDFWVKKFKGSGIKVVKGGGIYKGEKK